MVHFSEVCRLYIIRKIPLKSDFLKAKGFSEVGPGEIGQEVAKEQSEVVVVGESKIVVGMGERRVSGCVLL